MNNNQSPSRGQGMADSHSSSRVLTDATASMPSSSSSSSRIPTLGQNTESKVDTNDKEEGDVGMVASHMAGGHPVAGGDAAVSAAGEHRPSRPVRQPSTQASLEDFFHSTGPPSITIKADHPSPDKTTSTVVRMMDVGNEF